MAGKLVGTWERLELVNINNETEVFENIQFWVSKDKTGTPRKDVFEFNCPLHKKREIFYRFPKKELSEQFNRLNEEGKTEEAIKLTSWGKLKYFHECPGIRQERFLLAEARRKEEEIYHGAFMTAINEMVQL